MSITVRPRHLIAGAAVAAVVGYAACRLPTSAASSSSSARAAAVAVDCEPSQRALVQQVPAAGEPQITVRCVSADAVQPVAYVDEQGRYLAPTAPVSDDRVMRAVYTAPEPVVVAPRARTTAAPRVATSAPRTQTTTVAKKQEPRSWQKRALVIGGSAGAGAGLGALIGGKKGAAIGAAIGGGAGTLYEVVKHR